MIVKLKEPTIDYLDITPGRPYFVIGIESDDYRIINDYGQPYLYPPHWFEIVDPHEPGNWITEYGDDNERYSYPATLNETGFFEDYFDGKGEALSKFWHIVNRHLSK
jgi:hypothetical protein